MSRWGKLRDNVAFVATLLSLVLTVWFGLNVGNVFDVTRPYFIVPYGVIMFAFGCAAGYSFRSGMKARRSRADFEREKWEKAEAERVEREREAERERQWERRMLRRFREGDPDMKRKVTEMLERGRVEMREDDLRYLGLRDWVEYDTVGTDWSDCHVIISARLTDEARSLLERNREALMPAHGE